MPYGVYGARNFARHAAALLSGVSRVDILGFHDSNGAFASPTVVPGATTGEESNTGWDHGVQVALLRLGVPMYATGLYTPRTARNNIGTGVGAGTRIIGVRFDACDNDGSIVTYSPTLNLTFPPAPALWVQGTDPTDPTPHHCPWVWTGASSPPVDNNFRGMLINTTSFAAGKPWIPLSGLDYTADLRGHYLYHLTSQSATFSAGWAVYPSAGGINNFGLGPIQTSVRGQWSGNSVYEQFFGRQSVTLAAGSAQADAQQVNLHLPPYQASGALDPAGKFLVYGSRIEQPGRAGGFSAHTVFWANGYGLRRMAQRLQDPANFTALLFWIAQARELQTGNPGGARYIVFDWSSGVNDVDDGANSVGPSPAPSNTAAGAFDNARALVNAVKQVYAVSGWDYGEVRHIFRGGHWYNANVGTTTEAPQILQIRAGLKDFVRQNSDCVMVDLSELSSYGEYAGADPMLLPFRTSGATDPAHLTRIGYEVLAQRMWSALLSCASVEGKSRRALFLL